MTETIVHLFEVIEIEYREREGDMVSTHAIDFFGQRFGSGPSRVEASKLIRHGPMLAVCTTEIMSQNQEHNTHDNDGPEHHRTSQYELSTLEFSGKLFERNNHLERAANVTLLPIALGRLGMVIVTLNALGAHSVGDRISHHTTMLVFVDPKKWLVGRLLKSSEGGELKVIQ